MRISTLIFFSLLAAVFVKGGETRAGEGGRNVLKEFLDDSKGSSLNKKSIEEILYNIEDRLDLLGTATRIGGDYFLTAYHVVAKKSNEELRLVTKVKRDRTVEMQFPFQVVHYDATADLALLEGTLEGVGILAPLRLAPKVLSEGDPISLFVRLQGTPPKENYEYSFDGLDYYDKTSSIKNLGKLVFEADSFLLEREGKVFRFDEKFFAKKDKTYAGRSLKECFSTILSYHGESGAPVFLREEGGRYQFVGIVLRNYGIQHLIPVPNHPLRYHYLQQTGSFFAKRKSIREFIEGYLKKASER